MKVSDSSINDFDEFFVVERFYFDDLGNGLLLILLI